MDPLVLEDHQVLKDHQVQPGGKAVPDQQESLGIPVMKDLWVPQARKDPQVPQASTD